MKPIYVVLALVAVIAAFVIGTQYQTLRPSPKSQQPPIPTAESAPTAAAVRSLELQRMCADQASKAFKEIGYPKQQAVDHSFENHYSVKLGKCFVIYRTYDVSKVTTSSIFESLDDAFEGVNYGDFFDSIGGKNEPVPQHHVTTCEISIPGKQTTYCQTQDEWDKFKAAYMQN